MTQSTDVLIIGAGAAGLMCAISAGKRGRKVLVLDQANRPGKKILMSGGGRCNFTNYHIQPDAFISHNPHFCKSALSRYTQWDFIELVKKHGIPFHEKTLGQLFCDNKSSDILTMLLSECRESAVEIALNIEVKSVQQNSDQTFSVVTNKETIQCASLVIATGGLSIPTMGSSPFAYQLAAQFGLKVRETRAGLVPFTWHAHDKEQYEVLSGVSASCIAENHRIQFKEDMLFTHRGLSGPAMLQLSSYWLPGEKITVNLLPTHVVYDELISLRQQKINKQINTILYEWLPKKIIDVLLSPVYLGLKLADASNAQLKEIAAQLNEWQVLPNGTEGYRTAEVTLGGVDCDALSSQTMEARAAKNLYFIGEAVDVTGWLGGYNFQWAWSSGWVAGLVV